MREGRTLYFDFLKGIAILMVIAIHTSVFQKVDNLESFLHTVVRETCNVAVPLFLTISGYFIGKKAILKGYTHVEFLSKQLPRVYIPLLIWSCPMIIIWIVKGHNVFLSVTKGMLCMAHGPYYFIALIIQLYLLTPIFIFIRDKYYLSGWVFFLIINMLSVECLIFSSAMSNLPFVFAVSPFSHWMIFYYTGLCFSKNSRNYRVMYPFLIFILGFALQIYSTLYLQSIGYNGTGVKVSAWIYAWGLIVFLFSRRMENLINRKYIM